MPADDFWDYARARHGAYLARTSGEAIWTTDPVIAEWRFPNVYRELDPGTRWLLDWQRVNPQKSLADVITSVAAYRIIQRRETVNRRGIPADRADVLRWTEEILHDKAMGLKITSGLNAPRPLMHDLRAISEIGDTADALHEVVNGFEAHDVLTQSFGIGPYYGAQILADTLGHPSWHLGPETVVPLGHGARRGLSVVLTGDVPAGTHTRKYRYATPLTDEQVTAYRDLIENQQTVGHRKLWPHEIEQTLCELGRYTQIKNSRQGDVHVGRYRR